MSLRIEEDLNRGVIVDENTKKKAPKKDTPKETDERKKCKK